MDIEGNFKQIHQLVEEFFATELSQLKLSWGLGGRADFDDPFQRVKVSDSKIILRDAPESDDVWIVDATRGMIAYYLEAHIHTIWSRWNMATLISLIILPTTLVQESKKTTYRRQWVAMMEGIHPRQRRFDYMRWYHIFSNFGRKSSQDMLQEFIHGLEDARHVEKKLNTFLLSYLTSLFDEDDIEVLSIALKHQTLQVKELKKFLDDYSSSKLYRILHRLAIHLGEYLYPLPVNYGLSHLLMFTDDSDLLHELRKSPYFGSHFRFVEGSKFVINTYVPTSRIPDLLGHDLWREESDVYLEIPMTKLSRVSPRMYDINTKSWSSVFDHHEGIIEIDMSAHYSPSDLDRDELEVLTAILRTSSTDYRKLSLKHSQSKTKRYIHKIKRKNYYAPMVLWRYPVDLTVASFMFPVGEVGSLEEDQDLLPQIHYKFPSISAIDEFFHSHSFPYLSFQQVLRLDGDDTFEATYLIRVAATWADINKIKTKFPDNFTGVHKHAPGSFVVVPTEQVTDGSWDFDINSFINQFQ